MQLIMGKMLFKRSKIKVCVCLECDRDTAKMGTREAEGRRFFRKVKAMARRDFPTMDVRGTACTGGCSCRTVEEENASFSIALMGEGRFGYVLRRMNPDNMAVVAAFLRAYQAAKNGLLTPEQDGIATALREHIATRVPVVK